MHTYPIQVAGLRRELPICKVSDGLYIGAFICFGDAELTVACARELLKLFPAESYDYLFTAEAKSIPLIHEMARQSGSLIAMEALVKLAGGTVAGKAAVLAEGAAKDRKDIRFLAPLPLFNADGSIKE